MARPGPVVVPHDDLFLAVAAGAGASAVARVAVAALAARGRAGLLVHVDDDLGLWAGARAGAPVESAARARGCGQVVWHQVRGTVDGALGIAATMGVVGVDYLHGLVVEGVLVAVGVCVS